jgi:hypothetical protein
LEISPENQRVLLHRARGRVRNAIDELLGNARAAKVAPPRAAPTIKSFLVLFFKKEQTLASLLTRTLRPALA